MYANNPRNALIDCANDQTTAVYEVLERSEKIALNRRATTLNLGVDQVDGITWLGNGTKLYWKSEGYLYRHPCLERPSCKGRDESTKVCTSEPLLFSLAQQPSTTIAGSLRMVQPASPIVKARTQKLFY
ncbi:hypothetical protein FRC02_002229 [Tulasnella sp. 418]|nr:hypothetical protein FRC02_002229 [Tulasnella sp. 418]